MNFVSYGGFSFQDILPCACIPPKARPFVASPPLIRSSLLHEGLLPCLCAAFIPEVSGYRVFRLWRAFAYSGTFCQAFCSCLLAKFTNNAVVFSELPRFFLRVFMASGGALQWLESCVNVCDVFVHSPVSSTCRLVSVYLECQDLMDEFVNKVL